MRIGIDVDEVLADLMNPLVRFHNENYETNLSRKHFKTFNLWETWGGTEEDAKQKVYDFFQSGYFRNIKPVENSQESINILSKKNNLVIVTSRPDYIKEKTLSWIKENFQDCFLDVYFTSEWSNNGKTRKTDICKKINTNFMIEDDLNKSIEIAKIGINVLLFDCPWNKSPNLPKNITRIYNWNEILQILN